MENGLILRLNAMKKKAENTSLSFLIKSVVFALLLIIILRIGCQMYDSLYGEPDIPAIKTLNLIDKAVDTLDPVAGELSRKIPVQTNNEYIIGFSAKSSICQIGGENLGCVCVCETTSCFLEKTKFKEYCRYVPYEPDFIMSDINNIVTHELYLEEINDKVVLKIRISG